MKKPLETFAIFLSFIAPSIGLAQIITVTGAIEPEEMGMALIHEHVMVDWIGADSTGYHRWNRDEIVERALPYLEELKKYDVSTFLDCTPAYLGRDPYILKELAERYTYTYKYRLLRIGQQQIHSHKPIKCYSTKNGGTLDQRV